MPSVREQAEKIKRMSPAARVAGYLCAMAKIAELGADLAAKYPGKPIDARVTHASYSERRDWSRLHNALDPWHFALSAEERAVAAKIERSILAPLTRGEWPLPDYVEPPAERSRSVDLTSGSA